MDTATVAMANTASSKLSTSQRVFLLVCLAGTSTSALTGDWKFTPTLTLSERYSDNINLNIKGLEMSDWITEVTPNFSLAREGGKLKVNANYSLQGLLYASASDQNDIRHSLDGRANAELVKDWLFLDSTARISQQPLNLNAAVGLGDSVGIGNTSTVSAYTLSPYLKHRFGSAFTLDAKVTREEVFNKDSAVADTGSTRFQLGATSGARFLPLSWSGNYEKSDTDNKGLSNTGNEKATANARYQLSRKFGLLAQANMEKNDFVGASNLVQDYSSFGLGAFFIPSRRVSMDVYYNSSDNGNFVSGNLTLNPTQRTTINVSTSERAFGRTHALKLAHRTRKSNWSLSYQDDLTTSQQQFTNFTGYLCPDGILPPDPSCILVTNQPQSNETFVAKNLIGAVSYTQRKNTWNLSLFDNQREYLSTGSTDITRGVQASWSLRPGARTTFTLTGGMSSTESNGTLGSEDDQLNLSLVATRQFLTKVSGSLEVRHQERESNSAANDYAENSVAARLNMSF